MKPEPSDEDEEARAKSLFEQCWWGPLFLAWLTLAVIGLSKCHGAECTLAWDANPEPDIAGYRVYRLDGGARTLIDEVAATTATVDLVDGQQVTVTAYNTAGLESQPAPAITYHTPVFPRLTVSSEAPGYPASNALDGNRATLYAGAYQPLPSDPQWMELDLGGEKWVSGIRYLPRQDSYDSGHIESYRILSGFETLASGKLAIGKEEQTISFPPAKARFLRVLSGQNHITCAEISAVETAAPLYGLSLQHSTDFLIWRDFTPGSFTPSAKDFFRLKLTVPQGAGLDMKYELKPLP